MTEASTLLAIAFPPSDGLRGAMTTVGNIPWWYPNKSYAAHLCFTRNMELGNAYGNGNKAAKREAMASVPELRLTESDINRMAAIADENRTEAHHYPTIHPND